MLVASDARNTLLSSELHYEDARAIFRRMNLEDFIFYPKGIDVETRSTLMQDDGSMSRAEFSLMMSCRPEYLVFLEGVSRALVENSRTLRLPSHLHEMLSSIRNAKIRLEEKGITPSIDKLAEYLIMSPKKDRNATEEVSKIFSLDREAFPTLNGLPGETLHSYIADNKLENNPWHGFDEWSLKDEVDKLLCTTLGEREREIIRLYYGLDKECHTWEDISRQIGLSRERIRQVGLVAMEKLKHAARRRLEAILVKH